MSELFHCFSEKHFYTFVNFQLCTTRNCTNVSHNAHTNVLILLSGLVSPQNLNADPCPPSCHGAVKELN